MKIAYNPKTEAVITTATAANNDILFDLNAKKVWAKGLRMGADWEDISSKPSSLKNPYALTISLNGISQGPYDGSAVKNINITPSSIGAATSGHIHPYLPLSGGTVTGNIILKGGTSADMTYADNVHPYIRFDNSDSSQNVSLIFTDHDTYRRPAGIKLVGNQGNEWFEAANIYATTFYGALSGNATTATTLQTTRTLWGQSFDGTANVSGNMTDVGQITFSALSGTNGRALLYQQMADNDYFRIYIGATESNSGYAEIATADDGNEPIYVRQYTGEFSSIKRTLTLLDANGYTHFPSYINIGGNENNNSSPDRVWGSNGSDSYLRSYRTSALRVSYASSASNADTLDGVHLNGIFTAFQENGNATRLVIGGVTKDLTIPYSIKSNQLYSYSLPYTNYNKVGWYCKIASVSITTLYSSKTALLCITDEYTVTSSARYGLIYIKMQQQNALGSSPNVVIRVSGSLTTSLVTGILTLSSTTSKLDIYLKEDLPYQRGYISFIHGAYDIRTNSQELIQTLPSGTIINSQYGDISNQSASLLNSYKINGTSFNGTSDITTAYWGTTRTISLTGAITGSVSTNGGSDITINTTYDTGNITNLDSRYLKRTGDTMSGTLSFSPSGSSDATPKIYSTASGGLTSLNFEVSDDTNDRFVFKINYWNDTDTTNIERFTIDWSNVISKAPITAPSFNGNATSATKLQTARNLWGNSFDGTKDINGSIVFPNIEDTDISSKISWSSSSDGADIYYQTTGADQGNLVLNVQDDTNAYIQLALNGTFKSHFDVANSYWTGRSAQADKWTTARTFTIGNTAKNVDGSGNVSWSLAEIGVRDTWRTVQVNGTSIGNNTLNLCGSTYIGLTNVNGKVTFSLVGSGTTANQAILSNGTANGWTLKTLNIDNWDTAYNFVSTITGEDADKVINKWDEIVNFLAGITEDNKLNTLLNSKLSVYELANDTNVGAIKNNGIYYSTTDASSGTLVNSPFNTGFALINMTSYDGGDDLRRSRLAFNAYGEIKVSNDRGQANTAETWYNVLTSKNSGIDGSTIKLNGTSITVYSSSTADGRYVKKSGDTMTGALNFANNIWNKVGDDSYMGGCNVSGHFGIKAANTTYPGIAFFNNSGAHLGSLTAYNGNIKYGAYSLRFLDNGNTSVGASTWTNPFNDYNSNAVADGQAVCVWGQSSRLSNLAADPGNMSLWLKRVNAKAATLNMVLDGEYYANGNQRLAHVSEIPNSLKNPHALTLKANGTVLATYDGSSAKEANFTYANVGAASANHNHDNKYLRLDGSNTMTGQIKSSYSAGTQIAGCTNAILKATSDGYNSLICAPIKSGNICISAWTNEDNLNFGYAKNGKTENSFDTRMYWDAPNNNLHAAAFTGHLYGTADSATNSDTLDGYHASGLLTALSNTNNGISITVGGTTKSLSNISVGDADTVDGYHASKVYNAPTFTVSNSKTSNTYVLLATITISGTSLGSAEFTILFQNRECLDNSSFILSGAIRRNSLSNVQATLSYVTLHTETPRNIYMRSDDGVTFRVYIQSAASTWTTYYRAIPIVDSGHIAYSNIGTTSPISGSVLNITATKGGNVNYANSAGSADTATKVIVNQNTINDANYPLVWSNQSNTSNATENQLHKSWQDLYYNPKNKRLFVGGSVSTANINATGTVTSAGFKHSGVTENADQYILTADGGYTFLNQTSNELAHEFDVDITVTSEWQDIEDFYGGNQSFLTQPGTYIVQVYYNDNSADGMYEGYFSGIMSWFTGTTNSNNADEIVLHRVGHSYANTIYLRTRESLESETNPYTKLQISANSDLKKHKYKFKFKRIC